MVSLDWAFGLRSLQLPPLVDSFLPSGLPWDEARTAAAYHCLKTGKQWMFQLDSDVVCPPDTVMRLLSYRLPIVSGLYHQRFPTGPIEFELKYMPCIFNEGRDAQGNPSRVEVNFQYGQLVEVDYAPAGCLLTHRSVFERMLQAGIKQFFEFTSHVAVPSPDGKSEDFDFCEKARKLGFKVLCDTGIQCVHETQAKIEIRGLTPKL
jgi:hypothetical protein